MTASGARPGYLSAAYAASLRAFGEVRALPTSGGCVVVRPVPTEPGALDAHGSYPLLMCADWSTLETDLDELDDVVSLVAVLDPLAAQDARTLARCFPDLLRPYKAHFVVDLAVASRERTSDHHRRNAARGHREVVIERCEPATVWRDDWTRLYAELRRRRGITGMADFDVDALGWQLNVPGALVLRAELGGRVVGMCLWYVHGEVAYYHLAAYDERGYEHRASFALFERGLSLLAELGVRLVDLGGSTGDGANDGLARFKRGWSTGTRTALLGGRVVHRKLYERLSASRPAGTAFFPAYRS